MAYEAKIIADSVCRHARITTMQLSHPKCVHSEFMTHCMFARNASSSRAIPFSKQLEQVMIDPFIPEQFGVNQKGMQAVTYLDADRYAEAVAYWLKARDVAVELASHMVETLNIHKQDVNRLLEPWMWITVACTGTADAWANYFAQRCHPDADPKIQKQAYGAQYAYYTSTPAHVGLGHWHLPYITAADRDEAEENDLIGVSVARCARASYLTQEGHRSLTEDMHMYYRLADHRPMHASPFEHVAVAMADGERYGKYTGWKAARHFMNGEYTRNFEPNHPLLLARAAH